MLFVTVSIGSNTIAVDVTNNHGQSSRITTNVFVYSPIVSFEESTPSDADIALRADDATQFASKVNDTLLYKALQMSSPRETLSLVRMTCDLLNDAPLNQLSSSSGIVRREELRQSFLQVLFLALYSYIYLSSFHMIQQLVCMRVAYQ
jgi:hypothetical protein